MADISQKKPFLPPQWFVRSFWYAHRALLRVSGARLGLWRPKPGRWGTLRLTTIGRQSGQQRRVVVGYYEDGENLVAMAMNGWGEAELAWWLNLQAHPDAEVELADGPRLITARAAKDGERERLWARWDEIDENLGGLCVPQAQRNRRGRTGTSAGRLGVRGRASAGPERSMLQRSLTIDSYESNLRSVASTERFLANYLPYVLRQADQTLSSPFYAVLTEHRVARSEWRVLAVLSELGEHCLADLADAALSPQPTVTHAVRRLEERGLVARTPGTADRRQRFISVTDAGSDLTNQLIAEAKQLESQQLSATGDLSGLVQKLTELTETIEAQRAAMPAHQTEENQS